MLEDVPLRAGVDVPGYSFNEHPGSFCSAAFDPEDAFTGFHDALCIAVV